MYKFNENVYEIAKNRCSIFILDDSLGEYVDIKHGGIILWADGS